MNLDRSISEVFDIPDVKIADFLLDGAFLDAEINVSFGRTLISLNKDITFLKKCLETLASDAAITTGKEKELINSKKIIIESKLLEKSILIEFIKARSQYLSKKISYQEYTSKRDILLSNLIIHRAKIYRDKEWLKYWCQTNNIILDMDWFSQFEIYMLGNRRDSMYTIKNKLDESREIYSTIKISFDNGTLIKQYSESQKEIATIGIVIPYYIKEKMLDNSAQISYIMNKGRNK